MLYTCSLAFPKHIIDMNLYSYYFGILSHALGVYILTWCLPHTHTQNGFWMSVGFCGVLFIPVIVLAVILSTCYMRQQNNTAAYFMDDPYADYLMDDS